MRGKSLSNTSHGLQRLFSKPAKGERCYQVAFKKLDITLTFWLMHPFSFSPFLLGLTSDSWILSHGRKDWSFVMIELSVYLGIYVCGRVHIPSRAPIELSNSSNSTVRFDSTRNRIVFL
jgi:hypothetical protein